MPVSQMTFRVQPLQLGTEKPISIHLFTYGSDCILTPWEYFHGRGGGQSAPGVSLGLSGAHVLFIYYIKYDYNTPVI